MLPYDKSLHALAGAVIFSAAYVIFHFAALPALEIAAAAVLLAAIGKEIYDHLHRATHTPDPLDALATIAGGALVALPLLVEKLHYAH